MRTVDLGDQQRHVGLHSESRAVAHDDQPGSDHFVLDPSGDRGVERRHHQIAVVHVLGAAGPHLQRGDLRGGFSRETPTHRLTVSLSRRAIRRRNSGHSKPGMADQTLREPLTDETRGPQDAHVVPLQLDITQRLSARGCRPGAAVDPIRSTLLGKCPTATGMPRPRHPR